MARAMAPSPTPAVCHIAGDIANAGPARRRHYAEAALRSAIARVASASEGQRNDALKLWLWLGGGREKAIVSAVLFAGTAALLLVGAFAA
jgi:hypothetical protein